MNDDLQRCSKEELIEKLIVPSKRFGLGWQEKPEKVVASYEEELPILKEMPPTKSIKFKS